jgi:hypothetical protein
MGYYSYLKQEAREAEAEKQAPKRYAEGGSVKNLKAAAQELKQMGRGGDDDLVHVNQHEKEILKMMGGSGDINPRTGLREYMWAEDCPSHPNEPKNHCKKCRGQVTKSYYNPSNDGKQIGWGCSLETTANLLNNADSSRRDEPWKSDSLAKYNELRGMKNSELPIREEYLRDREEYLRKRDRDAPPRDRRHHAPERPHHLPEKPPHPDFADENLNNKIRGARAVQILTQPEQRDLRDNRSTMYSLTKNLLNPGYYMKEEEFKEPKNNEERKMQVDTIINKVVENDKKGRPTAYGKQAFATKREFEIENRRKERAEEEKKILMMKGKSAKEKEKLWNDYDQTHPVINPARHAVTMHDAHPYNKEELNHLKEGDRRIGSIGMQNSNLSKDTRFYYTPEGSLYRHKDYSAYQKDTDPNKEPLLPHTRLGFGTRYLYNIERRPSNLVTKGKKK